MRLTFVCVLLHLAIPGFWAECLYWVTCVNSDRRYQSWRLPEDLVICGRWTYEYTCGEVEWWFNVFETNLNNADEDMRQRKLIKYCNQKQGVDGRYLWAQPWTNQYWAMFKSQEGAVYGRYADIGLNAMVYISWKENTWDKVWMGMYRDAATKVAWEAVFFKTENACRTTPG